MTDRGTEGKPTMFREVSLDQVKVGDRLRVVPGDKVPA
jgi:cation transport ATPase